MTLLEPTRDRPGPVQRSFDDLGAPLDEVTFCVIDFETTGGAPTRDAITEIGAVKLRGGHCLGTFQTLVNPGRAIPPDIVVLTGITQAMVLPAPRIEAVLPSLLEFIGDAVLVGHNVRFDLGFLRAAMERTGHGSPTNRSVDTVALARRLVRDEVPNCKLGTLASRLRLDHRPNHRALDDALATGDLLHLLLERAARLGVSGLDDLLALPTLAGHEQATKLRLTDGLPRAPGVYQFVGRDGEVLYVGKATNLRQRVRSYFSGDQRRKVAQLLRETVTIHHEIAPTGLHAAVREIRLIQQHQPRFNRQAKHPQRYVYLKLTRNEAFPRLSVVRVVRPDGAFYLGPIRSTGAARLVAEAIEEAVPLRRCTARVGSVSRAGACAPAQLGVATCPCSGQVTEAEYAPLVERVVEGICRRPDLLLDPLTDRMRTLADEQRFEEAADVRNRAAALSTALARHHRLGHLRAASLLRLTEPGGVAIELRAGVLADDRSSSPDDGGEAVAPRHLVDELLCVAAYLDEHAARLHLVEVDGALASPLLRWEDLRPREPGRRSKRQH
jgi:DNA polymerase III subunit epsilon